MYQAAWAKADAVRIPLADRSVDMVMGSPPYLDQRTYGIGFRLDAFEWVEWMLKVTAEAVRVSRGAVIWIAAGKTKGRNYWPACEGLMWEWFKRGGEFLRPEDLGRHKKKPIGSMYRPCYWHRVGIAGSGSDQWFRSDVEYAMCFKRGGKLPYANNTANGHPPKWVPGGEMSHRLSDGTRTNQWGSTGDRTGVTSRPDGKPVKTAPKPSHVIRTKKLVTRHREGMHSNDQSYSPPTLANPGNLVRGIPVGGGMMGSKLAHLNEAPYPEKLAWWFIEPLCPENGIVCDPFSGSGTTVSVAARGGRRGIGFDLRHDQCLLGRRRYAEQATMFDGIEE